MKYTIVLLITLSCFAQSQTIMERADKLFAQDDSKVLVSRDSVLARVKVIDKMITEREDYLKRVPDIEKSLTELRAYRAGLLQPITDSTMFTNRKTGK